MACCETEDIKFIEGMNQNDWDEYAKGNNREEMDKKRKEAKGE